MHFPPRASAARVTHLLGLLLASISTHAADYTLMGWNDVGMHCMDGKDLSVFSVLPPFNTIHAQLTYRGSLVTNTINTNTILGKGDFMVVEADESDGSFLKL